MLLPSESVSTNQRDGAGLMRQYCKRIRRCWQAMETRSSPSGDLRAPHRLVYAMPCIVRATRVKPRQCVRCPWRSRENNARALGCGAATHRNPVRPGRFRRASRMIGAVPRFLHIRHHVALSHALPHDALDNAHARDGYPVVPRLFEEERHICRREPRGTVHTLTFQSSVDCDDCSAFCISASITITFLLPDTR